MAWYQKLLFGVDLEEQQALNDSLDAQLADLNRRKLDAGTYTPEVFAAAEANRQAGAIPDVEADVNKVFVESVKENAATMQSAVKETVRAPLKFLFGAIPWQVWGIAAVALFVYMGGWVYLRGFISRKYK